MKYSYGFSNIVAKYIPNPHYVNWVHTCFMIGSRSLEFCGLKDPSRRRKGGRVSCPHLFSYSSYVYSSHLELPFILFVVNSVRLCT
jgi:hypothetical protein